MKKMGAAGTAPAKTVAPSTPKTAQPSASKPTAAGRIGNLGQFAHPPKKKKGR